MDFQKFYAGEEFRAYTYLGAHPAAKGYVFRVYAPAAVKVYLIGDFSAWEEIPMQKIYDGQFYEVTVPSAEEKQLYKYRIYKQDGNYIDHADPYAVWSEKRPETASVLYDFHYSFTDDSWMKARNDHKKSALNIYEIHAGSWIRKNKWDGKTDPADGWVTYQELADKLIPYLKENHYNAVELMPLAEYPADESWGYQETGFFSATSRYGEPRQLQYLVEQCHRNGISVILDVVTVHFAVNDYALWNFDGTALYEYPHPAVGYSEWGSCNFMHSRGDVCSFLQSACAFWLDQYHFDGLRFDAVGNLIYWQGNSVRGVNKEAVKFMQRMNSGLKSLHPGIMLIAEDSTPFSGTTKPVSQNGLGFDYKWDLGWMNDTLRYMGESPSDRGRDIGKLLFSMEYFFNENYLLPLSHDEVVHGKGTIVNKMTGDFETRIKQAKLLYLYMFAHPGKKLNFMGNELAQIFEWDEKKEMDWAALQNPVHAEFHAFCKRLNGVYLENSALWQDDYEKSSFRWVCKGDDGKAVIAFVRATDNQKLLAVMNFSGEDAYVSSDLLDTGSLLLDTYGKESFDDSDNRIQLLPYEGMLLKIE
ncbi:MAG: 1,4-alpha-glucan branching protein GlgB [Clostridiales bacterium]|nr:1,4-alpha-glucan branching protein GlgB [Clostridiales bacterium]